MSDDFQTVYTDNRYEFDIGYLHIIIVYKRQNWSTLVAVNVIIYMITSYLGKKNIENLLF